MKKALPVIIVIVLFILLGQQLLKEEQTSFAVDEEAFTVFDTYEEILMYSRFSSDHYWALLEKAREYNLIHRFEDKVFPLNQTHRTIQIHEVWNADNDFYLLYSINLLPKDENPSDVPYITMSDITVHNAEDQQASLYIPYQKDKDMFRNRDGLVYDNRFYRSLWIRSEIDGSFYTSIHEWEGIDYKNKPIDYRWVNAVEKVTFDNLILTAPQTDIQMDPIQLDMTLTDMDEPLEVIELGNEVTLMPGTSIKLERIEYGLRNTKLYVELGDNEQEIRHLSFMVNSMAWDSFIETDENGDSYLNLWNELSNFDQSNILFTEALVPEEKELTYQLTEQDMNAYKEMLQNGETTMMKLEKEFGTLDDKLTFKASHLDTMTSPEREEIVLAVDIEGDAQSRYRSWFTNYENIRNDPERFKNRNNLSYIEVTDETGTPVDSVRIMGHGRQTKFRFSKQDFMEKKELHFRFFHLSKQIILDTDMTTIQTQGGTS
ncbi:hypothetical protein [Pseudalkalibacillus sp. SCS-8]|uniref:hypothetical protein n=1 Tax=Pseudalkalibacillus nanhaiensis TaxID=3115291 RepID=UPI0032DAAA23